MKKIFWKEHSRKAKTWMRALCMATVAVLGLAACDDDEKSIQFGELPATAQSFLGTYFTGIDAQSIVYDKEDRQGNTTWCWPTGRRWTSTTTATG